MNRCIRSNHPAATRLALLSVASALASATASAAPLASATACFDDIEQDYAWDDGGFNWTSMPDRCPGSPQPASPADRKWGGSVQIRASSGEASVIEESYAWEPKRHAEGPGCPRSVKTVTRRTRIAKGGVLYETRQVDTEPAKTSQRPLRPNEIIYVSNIQAVPKLDDANVQVVGNDTIAGQACEKIEPKQHLTGAGTYTLCVFVAPADCPHARYLQPLDMTSTGPDGRQIWHGRTTLLRVAGHGQLISPGSIAAP